MNPVGKKILRVSVTEFSIRVQFEGGVEVLVEPTLDGDSRLGIDIVEVPSA